MAQKGFAVISGSNTVVAKIMENGTVVFGQDTSVAAKVSGTLVLDLPSGQGDNRVLQIGTNNSASLAELSASQINSAASGNLVATNVQDALEELQISIDSLSASLGGTELTISSSNGTGNVDIQLGQLKFASSDANLTTTLVDSGNDVTVSFDFADSPSFTDVTASNVTASGEVRSYTLDVVNNATVGGDLRVDGNLVVSGSTVVLEVQNLKIEDPIIVLGSSSAGQVLDGDRGLVFAQSGSGNDPAFGWDDSDGVFRLGTTSDDGSTPNLTIDPNATLELGNLVTTGSVTVQNGLTVTGAVNLPAGSISNVELENSSINISGGVGITVSGLQSISLGGSGSISLDLSELSTVTVDVAADSLAIVDASNASASVLTTVASLAAGMASTGLNAAGGQLSVIYGSGSGTAVQGDTQITFSGVSGEIEIVSGSPLTLGSGGTISIGLPDSVTIGNLTVTGSLVVSGSTTLGTGTEDTVTVVGNLRHPLFSVSGADVVSGFPIVPDDYTTNPAAYSGYSFYLTSSAAASNGITPGSGSWAIANKWYFNENGVWHASTFYAVV